MLGVIFISISWNKGGNEKSYKKMSCHTHAKFDKWKLCQEVFRCGVYLPIFTPSLAQSIVQRVHEFSPRAKRAVRNKGVYFLDSFREKGARKGGEGGGKRTWRSNLSCFQTVIHENKILSVLIIS